MNMEKIKKELEDIATDIRQLDDESKKYALAWLAGYTEYAKTVKRNEKAS